ncbi:transcriptional regulator, AraC family [Solimonas aquatica]|uniref:Transcriptional regulator, AraC family n=1 Tax=Solimonas aquatica TaxID=489703 RepID=A0A1H9KVF7_9GAMM|nr:AraC family transcriptional regulator [Solimonas aquatica]SER03048.1 transcriptional regulator, AraC family [Solimonas aquatica]
MSFLIRVTGAWTQLLSDWLDREALAAPAIRGQLATYAPDDVLPIQDWHRLLAQACALRPELAAPGLAIGAGVQPRHVGVLGYLVLACANLGEAMLAYQRYERLFYGLSLVEVRAEGASMSLRWPPTQAAAIADETAIAALVTFLRRQLDRPAGPERVGFLHGADAAHARACEDFFGCPVDFGSSHTEVRFPKAYLGISMPQHEPGLRALLDRQAQALLEALPEPGDFDRAVQQVLLRQLPEGEVNIERVAAALHQSARTLQRRLERTGLSWQQLLDRTREQLARQYLEDRGLSLAEIALLLGYAEQSAFTRAFRRWTGRTPRAFRQRQRPG